MKSFLVLLSFLPALAFADGIATDSEVEQTAIKFGLECEDAMSIARIPVGESVYISASCRMGAYNMFGVLFVDSAYGPLEVIPLSTPFLGKNDKIVGWQSEVLNPALTYDEQTQTFSSENKGGMDNYLLAKYRLRDGYVTLIKYSRYGMVNDDFVETIIYQAEEE